jgi:hypothetical protein
VFLRPLGLLSVFSAAAVVACSGCGGGGSTQTRTTTVTRIRTTTATRTVTAAQPTCGQGVKLPPGKKGGRHGGTYYPDVKGGPVVSFGGGHTSCEALLALADAFATKKGSPLTSWLEKHGWRWMNTDPEAYDYMNFDRNDFEVFFSTDQNASNASQVAFPRG